MMLGIAKIVLMGQPTGDGKSAGPGCSSLLHRWAEDKFLQNPPPTIGVDFFVRRIESEFLKLQMWDTGSAERFRSLAESYLPGAACVCLIVDLSAPSGCEALGPLFSRLPDFHKNNGAFIVIGAKADEAQSKNMSACREFVEGWNKSHPQCQTKFVACSALSGEGCEEAFKATVEIATSNGVEQLTRATHQPDETPKKKSADGKLGGWGKKKK